jgi:hypothetical protein
VTMLSITLDAWMPNITVKWRKHGWPNEFC